MDCSQCGNFWFSVQQPAVPSNVLFPEVYLCGTVEEVMLSVFTNTQITKSSCLMLKTKSTLSALKAWHKCYPKSHKSQILPVHHCSTGSHRTWCEVWPLRARFRPLGCFVDRTDSDCAELPNCQAAVKE